MVLKVLNSVFSFRRMAAVSTATRLPVQAVVQSFEAEPPKKSATSVTRYNLDTVLANLKIARQLICNKTESKAGAVATWTTRTGQSTTAFSDGSCIVKNAEGQIVKTSDVQKVIREFRRDQETAQLWVRKFGIWSPVTNGRLESDGTFVYRNNDNEIHEHLDGSILTICYKTGGAIELHVKDGLEIVSHRSGEVWARRFCEGVEELVTVKNGVIRSRAETYSEPCGISAHTPAGIQMLVAVRRHERHYEGGELVREIFGLAGANKRTKGIAQNIEVSDESLVVAQVSQVETLYKEGKPFDTIYKVSEPVTIINKSRGSESICENIQHVRSFNLLPGTYGVVFIDHNGDENLFFPKKIEGIHHEPIIPGHGYRKPVHAAIASFGEAWA